MDLKSSKGNRIQSKIDGFAYIFFGVMFLGLGFYALSELSQLESGEKISVRLPRVLIAAYEYLGKWGVLVVGELIGAGLIYLGLKKVKNAKPEETPAQDEKQQ